MDLMSYLIMPIQRIPRYVLLLSDLLKFTDPTHPDHKNLTEAVAKVEGVARFINEKVKFHPLNLLPVSVQVLLFLLFSSLLFSSLSFSFHSQKREDESAKKLIAINKSIDGKFEVCELHTKFQSTP